MSEQRNNLDDLLMKTVAFVETLPDRISTIEKYVRQLELDFSKHEGEKHEGIQRISDRIQAIEKQKKKNVSSLQEHMNSLKQEIQTVSNKEPIDKKLKQELQELEDLVNMLMKEYNIRQNRNKTIGYYLRKAFEYFLMYLMLPLTIYFLILIGIDENLLPWWYTSQDSTKIEWNEFHAISTQLYTKSKHHKISLENVKTFARKYSHHVIWVEDKDVQKALNLNADYPKPHYFIWINPLSQNEEIGYIQVYGKEGNKIGSPIFIVRE